MAQIKDFLRYLSDQVRGRAARLLALCLIFFFYLAMERFVISTPVELLGGSKLRPMNEGWTYTLPGREAAPVAYLPAKLPAAPGEALRLQAALPEDLEDGMALVLHTSRETLDVWIDGREVLSSRGRPSVVRDAPLCELFFLPLARTDAGKPITVELLSGSLLYAGRADEIYYGSAVDCAGLASGQQMKLLLLYGIFVVASLTLLLLLLALRKPDRRFRMLALQTAFVALYSVYVVCENNLLQMTAGWRPFADAAAYIAFFLMPFPFAASLRDMMRGPVLRRIVKWCALALLLLEAVLAALHFTGAADLGSTFLLLQAVVTAALGLACLLAFLDIAVRDNLSLLAAFFSMILMLMMAVVEICSHFYSIMSYYNQGVIMTTGIAAYLMITVAVTARRSITALDEAYETKRALVESRVSLMLDQIRPHFIYNTLNSIQALIEIDPEKAIETTDHFAKYLRAHVDTMGMERKILFREELANIREYLGIEQIRFPRIRVEYEIEEDRFFVSALSIQPLVENAVKHGVSKKPGGGTVTIRSRREAGGFVVEVEDDGVGFAVPEGGPGHLSVGMKNITYRLLQTMNATVSWDSRPGRGTKAAVHLPRESGYDENYSG